MSDYRGIYPVCYSWQPPFFQRLMPSDLPYNSNHRAMITGWRTLHWGWFKAFFVDIWTAMMWSLSQGSLFSHDTGEFSDAERQMASFLTCWGVRWRMLVNARYIRTKADFLACMHRPYRWVRTWSWRKDTATGQYWWPALQGLPSYGRHHSTFCNCKMSATA